MTFLPRRVQNLSLSVAVSPYANSVVECVWSGGKNLGELGIDMSKLECNCGGIISDTTIKEPLSGIRMENLFMRTSQKTSMLS